MVCSKVKNWVLRCRRRLFVAKKRWKRRERLIFPSPAEARWAAMMGAIVITIPWIRRFWIVHRESRYPLCLIIPWGWYRDNYIEREIIVRGYHIDFGNRAQRLGIEINGRHFHDVVYDMERAEHLARSGWALRSFPASWVTPWSPEYRGSWIVEESAEWFS
jgi:hypothetical protein